ncbi:hypothetical protein HanIR_Chr14g0711851 [Helianthus annuus]|nr:hypothetical protein HanIR_Chr14g0711851 [Helianthus annuus]
MEELGIRPTVSIVNMVGDVLQKLGMMDKYQKLKKKYPPPKWEYRYIKGKRVKIRSQNLKQPENEFSNEVENEDSTNSKQPENEFSNEAENDEDLTNSDGSEVDEGGESDISLSVP